MLRTPVVAMTFAALVLAPTGALASGKSAGPASTSVLQQRAFTVSDPRVATPVGLARSTRNAWVYFTHNGPGAKSLLAVNDQGDTVGTIRPKGAGSVAWQDVDNGPGNRLIIGDIGNPKRDRSRIAVYRLKEPRSLKEGLSVGAARFNLRYTDGRHHAAAAMVHPRTGRVFVVTNQGSGAGIYRAPRKLSAKRVNSLSKVAAAPAGVTSASFAADGRFFVLATASTAYQYNRVGARPTASPKPSPAVGGASVAITRDGGNLLVGARPGSDARAIYTMKIPARAAAQAPAAPASAAATNVRQTTMTLNWQPPTSVGSSSINGYQVGWGTWNSAMRPPTSRSMDLTNFTADTSYTLRVRAHSTAGYGPWRYTTVRTARATVVVPPPPTSASALPARVVSTYYASWSGNRMTTLPTGTSNGYNVVFLAFARSGVAPGAGDGSVYYNHSNFSHAQIKSDVAALRAKGVRVLISVGGAGGYTHLNTDARRNAFHQSIKKLYNSIGPFDGLDWNFETNWTYSGTVYNQGVTAAKGTLPRILWICAALKNDYPGFTFTKPPSPDSQHDRTWIKAMNDQGTFDLVMPQYYDGGGPGFPNNISFWTSASGVGTASKVAPGIIDNQRYSQYGSGTGTQSSIVTRWNSAASAHPGLRGAMYWHAGIDAQTAGGSQAYWFANNFGATVRRR